MSKIIAVNCGSSSLKFQLYEMPSEEVLTNGIVERIGFDDAIFQIKVNGEKQKKVLPVKNHEVAVKLLLDSLVEYGIVDSIDEIESAGHRMVQGGDKFSDSALVTDEVEKQVAEFSELAPLHNPVAIMGYHAFKNACPNMKHVFVFDTAFHQTMPATSYMYPVPYEWYEKYGVRRYGAHGTSHKYVSERCYELMGVDPESANVITLHLGSGASISAVKGGKCYNTSMGFTPLAGIMMGTRSGDIDPAIMPFMMKKLNCSADEIENMLNKKSGLLGVSELSSDGRDINDAIENGNEKAKLALDLFIERIIQVVGSYYVEMGSVDAIVFTAGIGENDPELREIVMNRLESTLGVVCDKEANNIRGEERLISTADSKCKAYLIPTNEEVMIARDTYRLAK